MAALKRAIHNMPDYVHQALLERDLLEAYRRRPPYQQNDYIGWIIRGKQETTRTKRLQQLLAELEAGNRYMGMVHRSK